MRVMARKRRREIAVDKLADEWTVIDMRKALGVVALQGVIMVVQR